MGRGSRPFIFEKAGGWLISAYCHPAERDVADALTWYLEKSVFAAERLEQEINAVITAIARDPERFPKMDTDHRYALLKRFPFYVAYRIEQNEILILAVRHTARNAN